MSNELVIIALTMPVLFILHNLEEVIIFDYFIRKNKSRITKMLPRDSLKKFFSIMCSRSNSSFALAITILMLILTLISYAGIYVNNHIVWLLWLAATIIFTIQLVIHITAAIIMRGYAFGTITAVLFLPIFIYMIARFWTLVPMGIGEVVIATVLVGVVAYAGGIPLLFGRVMKAFDRKFGR